MARADSCNAGRRRGRTREGASRSPAANAAAGKRRVPGGRRPARDARRRGGRRRLPPAWSGASSVASRTTFVGPEDAGGRAALAGAEFRGCENVARRGSPSWRSPCGARRRSSDGTWRLARARSPLSNAGARKRRRPWVAVAHSTPARAPGAVRHQSSRSPNKGGQRSRERSCVMVAFPPARLLLPGGRA